MNLFEQNAENELKLKSPLANRVRPDNLQEFLGQSHVVGENSLLYQAIKSDKIPNFILHGPTGTGKTTLAKIIAKSTKSNFTQLNATSSGVKDIKEVADKAKYDLGVSGTRTILFVDEIHRFNKSQQDALLPFVEDGTLILIGATTENPYFEVNKALLSRSRVLALEPLTVEDISEIIKNAIKSDKGLGMYNIKIDEETIDLIADIGGGDARNALNIIEVAVDTTSLNSDGMIEITKEIVAQSTSRNYKYDKSGDDHYNTISAFIKSMRGSDADAAVYYLARMLMSGEDPKYIARRIVICAAEDVGLADTNALVVATAAAQAVDFVGMPEGRIILSEAVIYVATAPKSNSAYNAINSAMCDVENIEIKGLPTHLCDTHSVRSNNSSTGNIGYKYAHNFPNHYVKQQYMPDELLGRTYYEPCDNLRERRTAEFLRGIKSN